MKTNYGLISLSLLLLSSSSFAAKPIFLITPNEKAPAAITDGQVIQSSYTVKNNTPYNLTGISVVDLPAGITQKIRPQLSFPIQICAEKFNLKAGESCILELTLTGSNIAQGGVSGGPVVCDTLANQVYCSRPSADNELNITKVTFTPSAVGLYGFSSTSTVLLYDFSSLGWVLDSVSTTGQLSSIYCKPSTEGRACTAVGATTVQPPAAQQNTPLTYYVSPDHGWALSAGQPQITGNNNVELKAVACDNADQASQRCVAVGTSSDQNTTTLTSYTSTDGGNHWPTPAVNIPLPAGFISGSINSVACDTSSANTCIAVGTTQAPNINPFVSITTNGGTSWSTSVIANATLTLLNGVSCTNDAKSCVAVGTNNTGLVIYYSDNSGADWTPGSAINLPGSQTQLSSVNCQDNGHCVAVGSYTSSPNITVPLALYSNDAGHNWMVPSKLPQQLNSTDSTTLLEGVVCNPTSGLICSAVGAVREGAVQVIAYSSNDGGNTWVRDTIPQASTNLPQLKSVH